MMLEKEELLNISGGAIRWSAALGTLVLKAYSFVTDLGRYLGSAVSYFIQGRSC